MPKKIKFTAFATAPNGERGHGSGETTVSDDTPTTKYKKSAAFDLGMRGYKNVQVLDARDC